nr:zf-TFIIB domain-containing protein [Desulfobulbaceae bacterium]
MPIICRHCHKPTNEKSRYCVHCGGQIPKTMPTKAAMCPTCRSPLEEDDYRGSTIDICPSCQGIWLDTDEFAFHASERDTYGDQTIDRKFTRKPLESPRSYIPCVRCGSLMGRQNFRKISGVLIDVCGDHGVWLDAGELEQIRNFIANGGLDTSQDKAILANKTKISETAREVKDLNTLFRTLNKFNLRRILLQGF